MATLQLYEQGLIYGRKINFDFGGLPWSPMITVHFCSAGKSVVRTYGSFPLPVQTNACIILLSEERNANG